MSTQSLAYYYIRSLIHRPAVGSSLGSKASSSIMTLADSSKHIIQIIQLLEERRMSFTFCLNRNELLLLSGFSLLYQGVELDRQGKLMRDSQRLICSALSILERDSAHSGAEFRKIASSLMPMDRLPKTPSVPTAASTSTLRRKSDGSMPAPQATQRCARKQLQAIASRFSFGASTNARPRRLQDHNSRRATLPTITTDNLSQHTPHNNSQRSISSASSSPLPPRNDSRASTICPQQARLVSADECPNLDYLALGTDDATPTPSYPPAVARPAVPLTDWDRIFGCTLDTLGTSSSADLPPASAGWIDACWGLSGTDALTVSGLAAAAAASANARSALSLSDESSGEDLSGVEFVGANGNAGGGGSGEYRGIMMPNVDGFGELAGLDGNFGL